MTHFNVYRHNNVSNTTFISSSATAAQSETLNYYAQYYAAIAAQQQQGSDAVSQSVPQAANGAAQTAAASTDGQDYTQQWIEYYRAYGMHKEADQIESMARTTKGQTHEGNGSTSDTKPTISYPGFNYTSK